jgi:hypothetical protein
MTHDLMQQFRVAAREANAHCQGAPTQEAALAELAARLCKEGWTRLEVEQLVASMRKLVLARPV